DRRLPLLVRLKEALAPLLGQLARLAPYQKILGRETAIVNQGQHDGIRDNGAELLHEIKGQRWFAVPPRVVEAAIGIDADRTQGGEAVLEQQGVAEGQQGVYRITGRPAVARLEIEPSPRARRFEHAVELAEIQCRRLAFGAEED